MEKMSALQLIYENAYGQKTEMEYRTERICTRKEKEDKILCARFRDR